MNTVYFDGGLFENRIAIYDEEIDKYFLKELKGDYTNNELEYQAFIMAVKYCKHVYKGQEVNILGDSKLVVKQVNGEWKINPRWLKRLHLEALNIYNEAISLDTKITLKWIHRSDNKAGIILENIKDGKK